MTALLEILTAIVVGLSAAIFAQIGGGIDSLELSRPKTEEVRSVRRSPVAQPVDKRACKLRESTHA